MKKPGFTDQEEKTMYDKHIIGQYIIIYTPTFPMTTFSGRLDRIEDGHFILNPHSGAEYDPTKGQIRKMIKLDSFIPTSPSPVIELTSKKSLENGCRYANKQTEKNHKEEKERNSKKSNN
jgi:hypothetical protein